MYWIWIIFTSLNEYLLDRGLGLVAKGTDCGWRKEFWWRKGLSVKIHNLPLLFNIPFQKIYIFRPYYGLFWTWSPYLDLQWRSHSTGTIPELLITSIVWHKNKNRRVADPLWRSWSLFCLVIFHSSFGLLKYPYTKEFTLSPQGIPPSPVLVILRFVISEWSRKELLLSDLPEWSERPSYTWGPQGSLWQVHIEHHMEMKKMESASSPTTTLYFHERCFIQSMLKLHIFRAP